MNIKTIESFYRSQLQDNFLPYWEKHMDRTRGGILNCINNYGDKQLSDHKFTWSQGRYLWILGRLMELGITYDTMQKDMDEIYEFIIRHSIYEDSRCCYLLDGDGNKLIDEKTGRYDASIFADCFALIGLAQYVKVTKNLSKLPVVELLFESIVKRLQSGEFLTEPYPIPEGYQVHSIPMIMVNTTYEYIKMRESFSLDCQKEIAYGLQNAEAILNEFYHNGYIREHKSTNENYETRLLDRHVNPGHTLEDMWFIAEFLKDYGDLETYLPKIVTIACNAFTIGWDEEHGGLLRFVDREGGRPKGETFGSDFEKLIEATWDMKLWWPHSEVLYVFLYLYELTKEEKLLEYYEKAFAYVFETFPNKELGEWIQIRKRDGSPEEKVVALPVKDPFHIMRNFIKIVELSVEK